MQPPAQAKPNLFIAGQPKSGTSALFSFLKGHPDVCVCATKEPQYFCKDINSQFFHLSNQERNDENYLKLFAHCGGQKIIAEASTAYLFSRVAAEEIRKFNPDAKIIMMLREPVDFLFTYHMQMLRTSCTFEEIEDFLTAIELEPARKTGRHIPDNCFDAQFLHYSDRVRYTEQIERYRKIFPAEQLKIIIHDDFKSSNEAVYDEVAAFLGIDLAYRPQFKTINPKVGVRFRRVKQTSDQLLFPVKQWVRPYLPSALYKTGRSLYRHVFFRRKGLPTLHPRDKEMLMHRYKDEVANLGVCLGRDLTKLWGYDNI
jgi:Sulfotransferase domain